MHKKEILEKIKSQMLEDNTAKFNVMRQCKLFIRFISMTKVLRNISEGMTQIKHQKELKSKVLNAAYIVQALHRVRMKRHEKTAQRRLTKFFRSNISFLVASKTKHIDNKA